jgi:hypothetical protein
MAFDIFQLLEAPQIQGSESAGTYVRGQNWEMGEERNQSETGKMLLQRRTNHFLCNQFAS